MKNKHLSKYDQVFLALERPSLMEQTDAKMSHLEICKNCARPIKILRNWLNHHQTQNDQTCDLILDRLLKISEDEIQQKIPEDLKQHLAECERCDTFIKFYQSIPTFDELEKININIPDSIYAALDQKIERELNRISINGLTEKVINGVNGMANNLNNKINEILVEVTPATSPGLVRGQLPDTIHFYSHTGGDLSLQTKLPEQPVKLYAIFHEEEYIKKTDQQGRVLFPQLPQDDYRIIIDGFEVSDITKFISK